MNDARLNIRLGRDTLAFARQYATACNMTVTELVTRYLKGLQQKISVNIVPHREGNKKLMEKHA